MVKKQTDNPLTGGESGHCLAVSDRFQLINANGTAKNYFQPTDSIQARNGVLDADSSRLVLTAENKIRKGKAIFFLNNVKKCLVFLYYSTFYIAGIIMDIQAENKKEFGIPKSAMAIF